MPTFITPFRGTAQLTASTGLDIVDQGHWRFSEAGYNDGATFGLSLVGPDTSGPSDFYYSSNDPSPRAQSGGLLDLQARNWTISEIGNTLTSYTDPDTAQTYSASRCRITVTGRWLVLRRQNSNSLNSIGCIYTGHTHTDLGNRDMQPTLINFQSSAATYVIQGSEVEGGALDTFSNHDFYCRCTESVRTDNSNRSFQSNTVITPAWIYTYSKSWQID